MRIPGWLVPAGGILLIGLLVALVVSVFGQLANPRPAPVSATDTPGDAEAGPSANRTVISPGGSRDETGPLPSDVAGLLQALTRANAKRRVQICDRLAELLAVNRTAEEQTAQALEVIARLRRLVSGDPASIVRVAAVHALSQIQPLVAQPATLVEWLDHTDQNVRTAILLRLTDLGDAVALAPMLKRLRQPSYSPRWLLIDAIAAMKVPACVPDLARLAADTAQPRDDRVRALGHLAAFLPDAGARDAIDRCSRDSDPDVAAVATALR